MKRMALVLILVVTALMVATTAMAHDGGPIRPSVMSWRGLR